MRRRGGHRCRRRQLRRSGGGVSGADRRRVHMLVRGNGLADTMSRYLDSTHRRQPAIVLRTQHGNRRARRRTGISSASNGATTQSGGVETQDIRHVFMMTGAVPNTGWLSGCLALDDKGFIKTGPDSVAGRSGRGELAADTPAVPPGNEPPGRVCGGRCSWRQHQARRLRRRRRINCGRVCASGAADLLIGGNMAKRMIDADALSSTAVAVYRRNRERSRALFDLLTDDAYYSRPINLRQPIVFYEGHLPAFSFNTLVKRALGRPSIDAHLEQLFARGIDPEETSDSPDSAADLWPSRSVVQAFVEEADKQVLQALAHEELDRTGVPLLDGAEAVFTILEHEALHQETLLYMWHRLPHDQKLRPGGYTPVTQGAVPTPEWIGLPAGRANLGVARGSIPFGWDNEHPAHAVEYRRFRLRRRTSPTRGIRNLSQRADIAIHSGGDRKTGPGSSASG